MDRYGLSDQEQSTHVQQYNHALFQNSMAFIDLVAEINLFFNTVMVLGDRIRPELGGKEYPYDELYKTWQAMVAPEDLESFKAHLSPSKLQHTRTETELSLHAQYPAGVWRRYRVVLTPALHESGVPYCIYLGALAVDEEPGR